MRALLLGSLIAVIASCSVDETPVLPDTGADASPEDSGLPDVPLISDADRPDWWRTEYRRRRLIAITARGVLVPPDTSIELSADTGSMIASGELRIDGNDWRIVRHARSAPVELDRWIDDGHGNGWNSADTRTWFMTSDEIARMTTDVRTYVYYSRVDEEEPAPDDMNAVFIFGEDFENDLSQWTWNMHGEAVSVISDDARAGSSSLELTSGGESQGGIHRDVDYPGYTLSISMYFRRVSAGSMALVRGFSVPYADLEQRWNGAGIRVHAEVNRDGGLYFSHLMPWGVTNWGAIDDFEWHHVEIIWDQSMNVVAGDLDRGGLTTFFMDYGEDGQPLRAIALEGEGEDGVARYDNFIIKRHLDLTPTVTLGPVEMAP